MRNVLYCVVIKMINQTNIKTLKSYLNCLEMVEKMEHSCYTMKLEDVKNIILLNNFNIIDDIKAYNFIKLYYDIDKRNTIYSKPIDNIILEIKQEIFKKIGEL